MKISETLRALESPVNSDVMATCIAVKEIEDSGEYEHAIRKMGKWWQGIGIRPNVSSLPAWERAAILSRIGALSGWLGSMKQIPDAQEKAKDLICEGANLFEMIHDHNNWADTRSDLAICYWREGAFDEARVVLQDVLGNGSVLLPELKGKILLRLVTIETSTHHFETASTLLNQVDELIKDQGNPLLLGKFHFYRAFTLHSQGEDLNKSELLLSAVSNYYKASSYYKQAKHNRYIAVTENNIGNAFRLLEDFRNTHLHLDRALKMYVKLKDKGRAARVYDNKARAFIMQDNLSDAELATLTSVNMLREGGENATLAESLTTLGVVLSRGGNINKAIRTFVEAKEIALRVGDKESAGNAVVTHIEELQSDLTPIVFRALYLEADELLWDSPKKATVDRLRRVARKQFEINNNLTPQFKKEKYFKWKNFSLPDAVHAYERELILKALSDAGGRLTKAAGLLGVSHQSLSLTLHQRHKDLQQHRIQRKPRGSLKAEND